MYPDKSLNRCMLRIGWRLWPRSRYPVDSELGDQRGRPPYSSTFTKYYRNIVVGI